MNDKIVWWITQGNPLIAKPSKVQKPVCSWSNWTRMISNCYMTTGTVDDEPQGFFSELISSQCIVLVGNETAPVYANLLRDKNFTGKLLMMQDGGVSFPLTLMSFDARKGFFHSIKRSSKIFDGILMVHEDAVPLYNLVSDLPVRQIGLGYPREFTENKRPFHERNEAKVSIGGLFGGKRFTEVAVAIMRKHYPNVELDVRNSAGVKQSDVYPTVGEAKRQQVVDDMGFDLKLKRVKGHEDYLREVSDSWIGLFLDDLGSVGRFTFDMAALGIPTIVSSRSYGGKLLFPRLVVENTDIQKILYLYEKLKADRQFYTECSLYAFHLMMSYFGEDQSRERFARIMGDFGVEAKI